MPRIRSVHPGFFTDAEIVGMSDSAQLFFIGLWTEADDYGVFEWKPTSLKIKLRPASTEPVDPLLAELVAAERVCHYEHAGRQYGAIRNFCRYQRPKSPKSWHHMPPEFRQFVGLDPLISEIEGVEQQPNSEIAAVQPPPIPQKGEIPPQMEDGRGRMEEKKPNPERSETPTPEPERLKPGKPAREYAFNGAVVRLTQTDFDRWKASYPTIPDLVAELQTIDDKFLDEGVPREKAFGKASGWLRTKHEHLLAEQKRAPPLGADAEAVQWRQRLKGYRDQRIWLAWGPKPDEPGCYAPADLLKQFGFEKVAA